MRRLRELNRYRHKEWEEGLGGKGDDTRGAFVLPSPTDSQPLRCIVTTAGGWDHVSVSRGWRCPNWAEMEFVKRTFFKDDETAMQLHVPATDHVNNHERCLHLWRPQDAAIPRPPKEYV